MVYNINKTGWAYPDNARIEYWSCTGIKISIFIRADLRIFSDVTGKLGDLFGERE